MKRALIRRQSSDPGQPGSSSQRPLPAGSLALAFAIVLLAMLSVTPLAQAQSYIVLHTFAAGTDGANPNAGLVADSAGNFYGTTQGGGATGNGTVFKIDSAGNYSVLHTFNGSDGSQPRAGLRVDAAGNLYGTAWIGALYGSGLVFKIDPTGAETAIYNFKGSASGTHPWSSLISDGAGNFYGSTWDGGNESTCHSCGVVYKLTRAGKETVLHTFNGGADGANMVAGVVRDAAGNIYGASYQGGAGQCSYQAGGCGTIFKIDSSGHETILYTFSGGTDGAAPYGGLVEDSSGNLYGTTLLGATVNSACSAGCGVVCELNASGVFSVLHTFAGPEGAIPLGDLVLDTAGNLYGVTAQGGASGEGTVFRVDTAGQETILYSFTGGTDGGGPGQVRLLLHRGSIYGTTYAGGAGYGVVFKLTP